MNAKLFFITLSAITLASCGGEPKIDPQNPEDKDSLKDSGTAITEKAEFAFD